MDFRLTPDGAPTFISSTKNKEIIKPSRLGLDLKNDSFMLTAGSSPRLRPYRVNDSWDPVWARCNHR